MSNVSNTQQLLILYNRRLQKLNEKNALFGINTPPEILIEIEDIEERIEALHTELELLGGSTAAGEKGQSRFSVKQDPLSYSEIDLSQSLLELLAEGAESRIYSVKEKPEVLAKIFHQGIASPHKEYKLKAMIANPPKDETRPKHVSIAWPTELLYDRGKFVGYFMPRLTQNSHPLYFIMNPKARWKHYIVSNLQHLLRVAKNIAIITDALHNQGYVIGDIDESNILVTNNALVTFIDTDAYQVTDYEGDTYRCLSQKLEYAPPELFEVPLHRIDRKPEQDNFGLAVLIFQLLMGGYHPFSGRLDLMKQGVFPFKENVLVKPPHHAPSLETLFPALQGLFYQCFVDGHSNPELRPTPKQWMSALARAEKFLLRCNKNPEHFYFNHLRYCPECIKGNN